MQRRQILRWGCGLMAAGASTTAWTRQPAAAPVWRERALLGLGTTLWLKAAHPSAERADAALDAAVRSIRDVERQMSLFNADSALQRLNTAGRLDRPEPALRSVLTLSREIARRSNGAFDISMQPLWKLWSAAAAQGAMPSAQALQRTRQAVNWRALEVSTDAIRLNLRGMQLSLNGIAQGYAADSARDALIAHGIEHAWIDTGETALLGHPGVVEVAVVGLPDADLGQRIVAFVVGDARTEELIAFVAQQLSVHKRPREVRWVDALPRNAMGKVVKKDLMAGP